MTSEGTRYGNVMTRFTRACEQRDVLRATGAKELGYLSLPNALRLVCLCAKADDPKFDAAPCGSSAG
jgi:hypothetical protein